MKAKEVRWIYVALAFLIAMPFSSAIIGNSLSYDVVISDIAFGGHEETIQPNISVEFQIKQFSPKQGASATYDIAPGLARLLGPVAFYANITPIYPINDSIINCSGQNIFSGLELPKHYYRYTSTWGNFTDWSEDGELDCAAAGCLDGGYLTCHFKVDDSHLNSTEVTTTVGINARPVVNLESPENNYEWNESKTIIFFFNVTDSFDIDMCELILNGSVVENKSSVVKDTTLNFTHVTEIGDYEWSVNCSNSVGITGMSGKRNITQSYDEQFYVTNIGATGFEDTNQIYTYSTSIIANFILPPTATLCAISNDNTSWTEWKACESVAYWALDAVDGNKTVYAKINHTGLDDGLITYYSDWIILEQNGTHLDVTPPENFTVSDDGDYTNNNESFHATWDMPEDLETEILNGNFSYTYILQDTNGTYMTDWNTTISTEITITGLTLIEGHNYTLSVNATNPAGLSTSAVSDGIIIDITSPAILSVESLPDINTWSNSGNITFNWTANDSISGADKYSMILDSINDTTADDLPEDDYENNRTYTDKLEGTYYFHIKPMDAAGNIGETYNYGPITIDRTPPTAPLPANPVIFADSSEIAFYWQESTDSLSGISNYTVKVYDLNDTENPNISVTNNTYYNFTAAIPTHNYYIILTAFDKAGNNASSEAPGAAPIHITSARPDGATKIVNDPILRVETDKEGICRQNYTTEAFDYTNSTYHETKLIQANGAYSIKITCEDDDGYSDTAIISYTVDKTSVVGNIVLSDINSTYAGKTTTLLVSADGVGQIGKNDFKVYINNTNLEDYTVIDIDDSGSYAIRFTPRNAGTFGIVVEAMGQNSSEKSLLVDNLLLSMQYSGVSSPQNKEKITYADVSGAKAGLASEASLVTIQSAGNDLKIESSSDGKAFIFVTRQNPNLENKDKQLENGEFGKNTNSFGYAEKKEYTIQAQIGYPSIILSGLTQLTPGTHSLFIRNEGQGSQNKTIIIIEIE